MANKALSFGGSPAYVNLGDRANLKTQVITFAAWIKRAATGANHTILGTSGFPAGLQFRVSSNNKLALLQQNVSQVGESTGTIDTNAHHVAVTYDVSGNYVFYIDGSASGSGTNLKTVAFGTIDFYIGKQSQGEFMNGIIDSVHIYDAVLDGTAIGNLYAGTEPPTTDLQGFWKFNEGTGTSTADESANEYDGTLAGATTPTWVDTIDPNDVTASVFTPRLLLLGVG